MTDISRILEICNEFLEIPSSIAYEKPFLDYLEKKAKALGYNILRREEYLVIKPAKGHSNHLFSVHTDRHGMIRNKDNQIEYLAFHLKKKLGLSFTRDEICEDEKKLVEKLKKDGYSVLMDDKFLKLKKDDLNLRFIREKGPDFFDITSNKHVRDTILSYRWDNGEILKERMIQRCDFNHKKKLVTFDIENKLEEEEEIFAIKSKVRENGEYFYGQIDNVISVAVLFYLLENGNFKDEIIFTTKEEIGQSWKCVLDYVKKEDKKLKLVVLDTSPYESFDDYPKGFLVLRKGDENGEFDLKLVKVLRDFLDSNGEPHVFKPSDIGKTELGRVIKHTKGKINGVTLQLPTKNYHTSYETSSVKCLKNYCNIIRKLSKINKF
jgi:hypothetical protein